MPKLINLNGQRLARLKVLGRAVGRKGYGAFWMCQCDCGKIFDARGSMIKRGVIKSCGCSNHIDETGKTYGRLLVVSPNGRLNREFAWLCKCRCGKEITVRGSSLRRGQTKSCGCLSADASANRRKRPDKQASFNKFYSRIKIGASRRGYKFSLTKKYVKDICSRSCFYCGKQPSQSNGKDLNRYYGGDLFIHNGLDRVDNTKGYIDGNVVPCCWSCNRIKGSFSIQEFQKAITGIYNHWINSSESCE